MSNSAHIALQRHRHPRQSRQSQAKRVRRAIRNAGAKLFFLPPYSPDINPIEQVFSKLKHFLRHAAERTIDDTWRRVGDLLNLFQPVEFNNYLVNAGYASA